MDSERSPFALGWKDPATYSLIPYGDLPPIDRARLDGSFSWLPELPRGDFALAFEDSPGKRLVRLAEEAARHGLSLPEAFVKFVGTEQIHRRVPTCTACYLDLADRLVAAPGGGYLLRFMNDQQCVLLWYLYLLPGGEHAVVVATPEFDDDAKGETIEDVVRLTELLFCAPTFEEFVHRFWLENTIWFSLHRRRPKTPEQSRYLDALRARRAGRTWTS